MPLFPDDLSNRLSQLLQAAQNAWSSSPRDRAPDAVRLAIQGVATAGPRLDDKVLAADALVAAALTGCRVEAEWCDPEFRALVAGIHSLLRQARHSPASQEILRLCRSISAAAGIQPFDEADATRLIAALMVVEDAISAIEGYLAAPCFDHVDDAYLAKFGLLQAFQLGFDAAEVVCRLVGAKANAGASARGKEVLMARSIIAGHPLGTRVRQTKWQHFHDRASAHEKSYIRVMAFQDEDPSVWTGMSLPTGVLIDNGLAVMNRLLEKARSRLPDDAPPGAPGLLFPAHDWAGNEEDDLNP